jgi:hypothetical protein
MTEARSFLIDAGGGVVRVLRTIAGVGCYLLRYEVHPDEDMCKRCGCTKIFGCAGGCGWVTKAHDLCSACLEKELL